VTVTGISAGCAQVVIVGEIDLYSLGILEPELADLPAADTTALVADLSRVSFCGVGGVGLLLRMRERAHEAGVALELVVSTGPVRRILEQLDATGAFSLHPTQASALAAIKGRQ
jgi:anti-sigma B factor antagonist